MNTYRLIHVPSGREAAVVSRADKWWAKGWGVLGKHALPAGQGMWLPGVASVHTIFVRFPLDLLFLDAEFRAVRVAPCTPPGRWLVRAAGGCHTLELGVGSLASDLGIGDGWRLEPIAPPGVLRIEEGS